ncbi:protein maelstrom homolog [Megachile rotundata]|uniref:protein maelstrom homolog n=1 Tax=Megachile rotundata TaxID=143995 RepID=UPI000258E8A2|nr:PREDICTED: protein maelstrom homolog [Megachile rotundata]
MSKKNKGKNAFYFFMLDWKKREEASGRTFPEGLRDVQRDPKCSEEWQNLSSQEKGYYNKRAKDSKIEAQVCVKKKTAIGECIDEIIEAEKKQEEFRQSMLQYLSSVVDMGVKHKCLDKLKFIMIHVNWFYRREMGINKYEFCPAEFAVGEFSLKDGIENIYHEILNVKIPLGWKRDAIEISQQTHRIPVELPEGQSNFSIVYEKLCRLLENNKTGDKFPPLYTPKDLVPAVESLLTRMADAANASASDFTIYSLEALFSKLRNAAAEQVDDCSISLVLAEHEFAKDTFSSVRDLECDFHKIIDSSSQYCSMSIIKRWGFTICDYCCEYLNIPLIEGRNCPISQTVFCDEDSADQEDINARLKLLNVDKQIVEMNGVTEEHRRKVSERNFAQERRRREQETVNLTIIDHGKLNSSSSNAALIGRPLRLPKTTAHAVSGMMENSDLNAADFPPLGGKGKSPKRGTTTIKLPLGRGRGSVF